jgi:hypothetical protein
VIARAESLAGVAVIAALTAMASAQGGGKPATGNPTPGTAQPDPPNVAARVMFVGCLQVVTSATTTADANTPSGARFQLTKAEPVVRALPGTGPPADGPPTTSVSSKIYRLEGIDSQFSPFVGARVEISGEIKSPSAAEKAAPPTLLVEFVQRIAAKCS